MCVIKHNDMFLGQCYSRTGLAILFAVFGMSMYGQYTPSELVNRAYVTKKMWCTAYSIAIRHLCHPLVFVKCFL